MIYVFVAKIRVLESTYDQKDNDFDFENANLKRVKARLEEVFHALKVLACHKVDVTINLQLWNLDDRILRDKNHRRRPMYERTIFRATDTHIPQPFNRFQLV